MTVTFIPPCPHCGEPFTDERPAYPMHWLPEVREHRECVECADVLCAHAEARLSRLEMENAEMRSALDRIDRERHEMSAAAMALLAWGTLRAIARPARRPG